LVVYEPGRRGAAALEEIERLKAGGADVLTVVALAPGQQPMRCVPSAASLDAAIVDAAERDLADARRRLGPVAAGAEFLTLSGDAERALADLIQSGWFDVVLMPGGSRVFGRRRRHRLSGIGGVDIRFVPAAHRRVRLSATGRPAPGTLPPR
jgi:hypothetical protein